MHSNGFHSSSQISEKCREDKEAFVNMKEKVARTMTENWSERLKDETSAEQGILVDVKEAACEKEKGRRV